MKSPSDDFEELIDTSKGTVHHVSRWNGKHSTGAPLPGAPGSNEAKKANAVTAYVARSKEIAKTTPEPGEFRLTFGKHKGKRMRELPDGYLRWLANCDDFNPQSPAETAQFVARLYLDRPAAADIDSEFQSLVASF